MVGRPKSESSKRSSITLRVTQEEKKQYEEAAEKLGVSVSQYCRIAVEGEYRQWLGGQELASRYHDLEKVHWEGPEEEGHLLSALHNAVPRLLRVVLIGYVVAGGCSQDVVQDGLV